MMIRIARFLLFSLALLGLASCGGGGGGSGGSSSPPSMTIMPPPPPPEEGRPDLVIDATESVESSGQEINLLISVSNRGTGRAAATTLRFKSHTSLPIVEFDPTVGTDSVPSLGPSQAVIFSITLPRPSTAGTYYYGACVDAVSGESDTTNNCSGDLGLRVVVTAPQTNWGAISFSFNGQGAYNWAFRSGRNRSEAINGANNACRANGGRACQIAVATPQCGALAVGTENGRVTLAQPGIGPTISEAERDAINRCRSGGGRNCRIDSSNAGGTASFCAN